MKAKIILCGFIIFCISWTNAQNETSKTSITGKVVIAADGITLGTSTEIPTGSTFDFSYNGKRLDISIGNEVAEGVELSAGMGFQLNGEGCFYMSLKDGIEVGAVDIKGNEIQNQLVKVVPNANFNTSIESKGEICYNFLNNKTLKFLPSLANYQNVIAVPQTASSVLDFLRNLSVDFTVEPSIEAGIIIPSSTPNGTPIPSYCFDWEKEVPIVNLPFQLSTSDIPEDLIKILPHDLYSDSELQETIWLYRLSKEPTDKYIRKFSIAKSPKTDMSWVVITFLDNIKVLYFPFKDSFENVEVYALEIWEQFRDNSNIKVLENGGVLVSNTNPELLEALALNRDWTYDKFLKMLQTEE